VRSLPVKLTRSTFSLSTKPAPTFPSPTIKEHSAPGRFSDWRTWEMILTTAREQRGVVSLGFQMEALPVTRAREKFHPKT
jgi:hypothetical protein